jgi:hypothetical protein
MKPKKALLILCLVSICHLFVNAGFVWREPAPTKTFHDYDEILIKYPSVMRGDAWSHGFPLFDLVPNSWPGYGPADVYKGMFINAESLGQSYKTSTPISYVISSVIPALFGISLWTTRLGSWPLFFICSLCIFDIGRRLKNAELGLYSALMFGFLPVAYQGMRIGIPTLGNMTGISIALWALVASNNGKNWFLAAFTGLAIALSARWGESVGDALSCLAALSGPTIIASLLALSHFNKQNRLKSLAGLTIAGAVGYLMLDLKWIKHHTERYVLSEAGLNTGDSFVSTGSSTISDNPWRYFEALRESLMLDHHFAISVVGFVLCLMAFRHNKRLGIILASPIGAWIILNSSSKGQDFYAAPMIPSLSVLGGMAIYTISKLNRWLGIVVLAWFASGWILYSHLDIPSIRQLACTNPVFGIATRDAAYCNHSPLPERAVYQWFRKWRQPPGEQEIRRREIANWLLKGSGRKVIESLPMNSMVMMLAPPGDDGDVLAVLIPTIRPDLFVHRATIGSASALENKLMEHFEVFYAISFNMPNGRSEYILPNWIIIDEEIERTEWLKITLSGGRLQRVK